MIYLGYYLLVGFVIWCILAGARLAKADDINIYKLPAEIISCLKWTVLYPVFIGFFIYALWHHEDWEL